MEQKTVTAWAKESGVVPNTAILIRAKIGVGKNVGRVWLLSPEDWQAVLENLHDGPGRPRKDYAPKPRTA